MLKVGLTGGMGSGKSTAAMEFEKLGVPVFFADDASKKILEEDIDVQKDLKNLLGDEIYVNGSLNRPYMASIVFNDEVLLSKVNGIIHPKVNQAFKKWCAKQTSSYVLKEAAILFEIGSYLQMDKNILITAPREERIERVIKRSGWTKKEIEARMSKQWSDELKIPLADFVIENLDIRNLVLQIKEVHESLIRFTNS